MQVPYIIKAEAGRAVNLREVVRPGVYVTDDFRIVFLTKEVIAADRAPHALGRICTDEVNITRSDAVYAAISAGHAIPNVVSSSNEITRPGAWVTPMGALIRVYDHAFDRYGRLRFELVFAGKGVYTLIDHMANVDLFDARVRCESITKMKPNF